MGTNEKFCLRWNDFESNISVAFREIREEKDFFDCTLSCGSRQIQAHKLILSACSPFFRSILRQNPHQHPLLYLKGVQFTDLQAVLNFMYHGEVNVAQEELNSFLSVAEDLQVKGLTQSNTAAAKPKTAPVAPHKPRHIRVQDDPPPPPPVTTASPLPTPRPQPSYQHHQDDQDIQEVLPVVKTEPEQSLHYPVPYQTPGNMSTEMASVEETYVDDDGYDYGGYEGAQGEGYGGNGLEAGVADTNKGRNDSLSIHVLSLGGKYQCALCQQFTHHGRQNVLDHVEAKHLPNPCGYKCNVCNGVYKTSRALYRHNLQHHRNK